MESIFSIGLRKSTGKRQNRCIIGTQKAYKPKREPGKENSLLSSQSAFMGVLSDDFAAVDFRKKLCYHSRPKKQIQRLLQSDNDTVKIKGKK